jgi:D-alanine-D-alanine ligase
MRSLCVRHAPVIEAVDKTKYEVVPIAITKEGNWLGPSSSREVASRRGAAEAVRKALNTKTKEVAILGDPSRHGLMKLDTGDQTTETLDVVFPVLHGTYGEDGTLQGLLEMAAIPFVGLGTLASACGMDKVTMKALFRRSGLADLRAHVVSTLRMGR